MAIAGTFGRLVLTETFRRQKLAISRYCSENRINRESKNKHIPNKQITFNYFRRNVIIACLVFEYQELEAGLG